jgi:hypothetical protein
MCESSITLSEHTVSFYLALVLASLVYGPLIAFVLTANPTFLLIHIVASAFHFWAATVARQESTLLDRLANWFAALINLDYRLAFIR